MTLSDKAVIPLTTLDPAAPLDDLTWLDEVVGEARVVAIGESSHYNREFYLLRHRLLRYLAERHGFGAYALESGFTEGLRADAWIRGEGDLDQVMANSLTSLMGLWTEMRAHLEWMRRHQLNFYGIDVAASAPNTIPGLDAVTAYLAEADPEYTVDPAIRETSAVYAAASPFSARASVDAYGGLTPDARNTLTASLADLHARVAARRVAYVRRTGADAYERALRSLALTVALDAMIRDMTRGVPGPVFPEIRELAMADTVDLILQRHDRIVLAAHNGHVQRTPIALPGMAPSTTLGMNLADRLGDDYLVIGTTSGPGQTLNIGPGFYTGTLFTELGPPQPGTIDALMAASHDGLFATDLRRLSGADADMVGAVTQQGFGSMTAEVRILDSYDVLVHVPRVTAAEPDRAALAQAPREVREAFSQ